MSRIRFGLAALTLAVCASAALAQEKAPRRPHLDAAADTNSAGAYYYYGMARISNNARDAADAFYWASRLDPSWADPLYARRVALLTADRDRLVDYLFDDPSTLKSKEIQRIDSLYFFAMLRNPFVHKGLDHLMLETAMLQIGEDLTDLSSPQLSYRFRAWVAYTKAQLPTAITLYAQAIKKDPKDYSLHFDRAQPFYLLGQTDSAAAEIQTSIDLRSKDDKKKLVYVYESKAMQLYTLGWVWFNAGQMDKAREAFGNALTEDLSFYRAHVAMATIALKTADTTQALQEYGLAVDLNGTDPALRFTYGATLYGAKQYDQAIAQLQSAISLDPEYALPYYYLGEAYEASGKKSDAVAQYTNFIARASRDMGTAIDDAKARSTQLTAGGGA